MKTRVIAGQESWRIASPDVEAYITRDGGHLAPVTFDRKGTRIRPFSIAPWGPETLPRSTPQILKALRGDFFCMPFGGNAAPVRGKQYPVHGDSANARWRYIDLVKDKRETTLHLQLLSSVDNSCIDKIVTLITGHNAVYSRHTISGFAGRMSFGHHAMLKFPDKPGSGLISTSAFIRGQVAPLPVELPENRGYSMLQPGANFTSLDSVPTVFGDEADLSSYPARRGYEDLVMMASDPTLQFAWTAVSFPNDGYVWFALKDPRVLRQTIFWFSNGGRHYPPWNGRHVNVMGLEEVTSYFHYGLKESSAPNPWSKAGIPTALLLKPQQPLTVNTIMAVAQAPRGFGRVVSVEPDNAQPGVILKDVAGRVIHCPLAVDHLHK